MVRCHRNSPCPLSSATVGRAEDGQAGAHSDPLGKIPIDFFAVEEANYNHLLLIQLQAESVIANPNPKIGVAPFHSLDVRDTQQ